MAPGRFLVHVHVKIQTRIDTLVQTLSIEMSPEQFGLPPSAADSEIAFHTGLTVDINENSNFHVTLLDQDQSSQDGDSIEFSEAADDDEETQDGSPLQIED